MMLTLVNNSLEIAYLCRAAYMPTNPVQDALKAKSASAGNSGLGEVFRPQFEQRWTRVATAHFRENPEMSAIEGRFSATTDRVASAAAA